MAPASLLPFHVGVTRLGYLLLYRHGLEPLELTDLRDRATALATTKALCRKTRAKNAPLLCERATAVAPHWTFEVFGWSQTGAPHSSRVSSNSDEQRTNNAHEHDADSYEQRTNNESS